MSGKIYTRTGDSGETGLFAGGRVPKNHPRVAAYGAVDELNALLGQALAAGAEGALRERLELLQEDLLALGAELATPRAAGAPRHAHIPPLPVERIAAMERWIDEADEVLPPLTSFILPGGAPLGAALHVARTVCRRAERQVVELAGTTFVDADAFRYLNRLSDYLFVAARLANRDAGRAETTWRGRAD